MEHRNDAPIATLNGSIDMPVGTATSTASAQVLLGEGLRAIIAERMKQVDRFGFTLERDQVTANNSDFALAGVSYANAALDQLTRADPDVLPPDWNTWPWDAIHWNPKDPRANLVRAAALLWAAIDWLDNAPRDAGDAVAVAA